MPTLWIWMTTNQKIISTKGIKVRVDKSNLSLQVLIWIPALKTPLIQALMTIRWELVMGRHYNDSMLGRRGVGIERGGRKSIWKLILSFTISMQEHNQRPHLKQRNIHYKKPWRKKNLMPRMQFNEFLFIHYWFIWLYLWIYI